MSLRWKIIVLITAVFALDIVAMYLVESRTTVTSFAAIERSEAVEDVERCVDAVRTEIGHLSVTVAAWSLWDDMYQFAQDGNERFRREYFVPATFQQNRIDLFYICRRDGRVVFGQSFRSSDMKPVPVAEFTGPALPADHPLLKAVAGDAVQGILLGEHGPLLVAAQPILRSDGAGPAMGCVIMGRWLNEEKVARLAEQTRVQFRLRPLGGPPGPVLPEPERAVADRAVASGRPTLREVSPREIVAYAAMPDIHGRPVILFRASIPRLISARGIESLQFSLAASVGAAGLIVFVLWVLLERIVVRPLAALTGHATRLGREDDIYPKIAMNRRDEIGILADEFDRMVARLAESHARLVEAARRAGMADVAAGLLHNVGNAINTVGVSAETIREKIDQSRLPNLNKATAMLEDHREDLAAFLAQDERGRKLIAYLPRLSEALSAEHKLMYDEVRSLYDQVQHIKDLLESQQAIADGPRLLQEEDIGAIVRESVDLQAGFLERHRVRVQVEIDRLPRARVNRLKLIQVLENLIRNGVEAIVEADGPERRLRLRAALDGENQIRIDVEDTGVGIDPAHLDRVFGSGFTTKPRGKGVGLHFCANAVIEMGGRIEARSDGPRRGACITFWLPAGKTQVAP